MKKLTFEKYKFIHGIENKYFSESLNLNKKQLLAKFMKNMSI